MLHIQGKKQPREHVPEGANVWDLIDKDFILAIINVFEELKETISKELKESVRTMSHQIENINKEIEII